LRNFTQSGSTAQTLSVTSGTAALHLESGSTFNGNVNFNFPQLVLSGTSFAGTATLEKNGATSVGFLSKPLKYQSSPFPLI
jgi:hypothetical protein